MKNETRILVTWQKDRKHSKPYNEWVVIFQKFRENLNKRDEITSQDVSPEEDINLFTPLERSAFMSILMEGIDTIGVVIGLLKTYVDPRWTQLHSYKPPEERYGKIDKRALEDKYERLPLSNIQKLQKDLCFIHNFLKKAHKETMVHSTFSDFMQRLQDYWMELFDDEIILVENFNNKLEQNQLRNMTLKEKQDHFNFIEQIHNTTNQLRREMEDLISYSITEIKYITNWQHARSEQNHLSLDKIENVFNNIIRESNTKMEYEVRMHTEIEAYIEEVTQDYLDLIQYWMKRYDDEIEAKEGEILQVKINWEILSAKHVDLEELYLRHKQELEEYKAILEERRIRQELFIKQTGAAIRIQAWWRGVMVRRKLGKYRKKKKKGKGKDKKGKKSGKGKKK